MRRPAHAKRFSWRASAVLLVAGSVACGGGEKAPGSDTAAQPVAAAPAAASSGEQLFQRCVTCHQANGQGLPGSFPPLAGSEFANAANVAIPINVVTRGIQGPLTVKGAQYNGVMPAYGTGIEMSDEEVAAVLTYVRQSWGNTASAVTAEDVAKVRAAQTSKMPVTEEELKALEK